MILFFNSKNDNNDKFEVQNFIINPNEFIVYLIGFLNDYTLKNRIFLKKIQKKNILYIKKHLYIFFLIKIFLKKVFLGI